MSNYQNKRFIELRKLKIRSLMIARKITQEQLAERLGVCESSVNKKIGGKTPWGIEEAYDLADILNTSVEDIFNPKSYEIETKDNKAS